MSCSKSVQRRRMLIDYISSVLLRTSGLLSKAHFQDAISAFCLLHSDRKYQVKSSRVMVKWTGWWLSCPTELPVVLQHDLYFSVFRKTFDPWRRFPLSSSKALASFFDFINEVQICSQESKLLCLFVLAVVMNLKLSVNHAALCDAFSLCTLQSTYPDCRILFSRWRFSLCETVACYRSCRCI
jgi:hypothetical protein